MRRAPSLAAPSFPLLSILLTRLQAQEADPLILLLLVLAPEWQHWVCPDCECETTLALGWRGLYWECPECEDTGTVSEESHEALQHTVQLACTDCGELLSNRSWHRGCYLACDGCEKRSSWKVAGKRLVERNALRDALAAADGPPGAPTYRTSGRSGGANQRGLQSREEIARSLRDYGLEQGTIPTASPETTELTDVVKELMGGASCCPNCGCADVVQIEVSVEHPKLRGGHGTGYYAGCPACPWASPMLTVAEPEGEDE